MSIYGKLFAEGYYSRQDADKDNDNDRENLRFDRKDRHDTSRTRPGVVNHDRKYNSPADTDDYE